MSAQADSHDSASMAMLPSVAEVDGWEVESSSANQPTNEELAERLREEPVARVEGDADATEALEPVSEDHNDAAEPVGEDAAHPKKRKLTASERKAVLQAEFNSLTKQREDARRAFEAEERERAAKRAAPPAATPADAAKIDPVDGEPDWDQYEADGKLFSQYQKDHAAWLRKVITAEADERAIRAADARISAAQERDQAIASVARHEARVEQAKATYPDFDEVIEQNLADVEQTPFMRAVVLNHAKGLDLLYHLGQHPAEAQILAQLPMTRPIMDAVKEAADPIPILSYFATHPAEHDRIAHLDPPRQLLALGRLSAALSSPGAKNGSPAVTPPVTHARPPIRPVGTRGSATASGDDDLEFGPEWLQRENERDRQRQAAHR